MGGFKRQLGVLLTGILQLTVGVILTCKYIYKLRMENVDLDRNRTSVTTSVGTGITETMGGLDGSFHAMFSFVLFIIMLILTTFSGLMSLLIFCSSKNFKRLSSLAAVTTLLSGTFWVFTILLVFGNHWLDVVDALIYGVIQILLAWILRFCTENEALFWNKNDIQFVNF